MGYFENFDKYRAAWILADAITPEIPLNIDLELTSICNLKCPFCFLQNPAVKIKRGYMPFELAKKIIDQAADLGVPALKFNWRGEATLHPQFTQIIKYARKKQAFYDLLCNTNGNVPDASFDGLMACTKVMVSLDSLVNSTYLEMRKGGSRSNVIHTINFLLDRGHKNLWVRRVITSRNKSEQFTSHCREMWGTKVKISEHYCFERGSDLNPRAARKFKRKYCGYPSQRIVVGIDGKAFPCCVDYSQIMPLGDLNKHILTEIWNNKKLRQIRKDLKMNRPQSAQCKNCTSFMAYDMPQRYFVQDRKII
jgi:radical SAM protein with 4Fe4S-binding SPASM domain